MGLRGFLNNLKVVSVRRKWNYKNTYFIDDMSNILIKKLQNDCFEKINELN